MNMPAGVPEPKLAQLYQDVILDHNRNPRNFKELTNPSAYSHGYNPLCGDDYHLYVNSSGTGLIEEIGFKGNGCAISKASASMMTTMIKGKTLEQAEQLEKDVLQLLTKDDLPQSLKENTGRMVIFEGVKQFPVRVKCATLIWHALADAIKDIKNAKEA